MHIIPKFADIIFVLIAAISIYVFLIAPSFIKVCLYFSKTHKTLYVQIKLFGAIRIISIKAIKEESGFYLYKNGKPFDVKKMLSIKKMGQGIKFFSDYHVKSFFIMLSFGGDNAVFKAKFITLLLNTMLLGLQNVKPYFKYGGSITVSEKDDLNICAEFCVLFNALVVIASVLKTIWGKING